VNITRDEHHQYLIDGQRWPSVTQVLGRVINKPFLNRYREKLGTAAANEVRDAAGTHGTFVHALASLHADGEAYLPLGPDDPYEAAKLQIDAFTAWYDENVEECFGTEIFVAHPAYRYAGQLDFLLRIRGDKLWTVLDIKSGASVGPEVRAQTAAYRDAALATILTDMGEKGCRRAVLHIPSGEAAGKLRFIPHDNHAADSQAWLSVLYVYRWLKS